MLEPRFTVRYLSQLLQLSETNVRKRIESREFGRYFVVRRGVEVTLRGLQAWMRANSADPDHALSTVEPFYSTWFLAATYGCTQQQIKDAIGAGEFGPCLKLSGSHELRVPLSGLIHYNQATGVGSALAS